MNNDPSYDGWKDRGPVFPESAPPAPLPKDAKLTDQELPVAWSIVQSLKDAANTQQPTIRIDQQQTSIIPKIIKTIKHRKENSTGDSVGTGISTNDAVTYLTFLQGSSTLKPKKPDVFGKLANKIVAAVFPNEPLPWSPSTPSTPFFFRTQARMPWKQNQQTSGRRKSRKLGNTFNRCVKSVRSTVRARKGSTKESAAIAICTKSVLHTRGKTMKRYRKGRLVTQKKFRGGNWGTCS